MDVSKIAVQIASEFTGSKAFKQAETATQKLERQVKNLGRSLGVALGTAAIVRYAKTSVKAFAQDENAARSLGMTLKNLGLDYFGASDATNLYISNLEKQTGVLDDELRPAMDRFLRATSSITESQKLLNLALDISAGTGKDLTIVSQGLQKAYLGNNASLGRLGVGLTKAELTSSSFLDIQERLAVLFAGQAKSAADSFAGSLNKLTVASNNAKESIGKGLIDALTILSGGKGNAEGGVKVIDKMAASIAEGARNIAFMIKQFEALKPVIIAIGALLLIYFAPITAAVAALAFILAKGGENLRKSKFNLGPAQQSPGERIAIDKAAAAQLEKQRKADAAAKAANAKLLASQKAQLANQKKITEEKKKQAALELASAVLNQAGGIFDIDKIQLAAAAMGKLTEEDKVRVRLKQEIIALEEAINSGNISAAAQIGSAIQNDAKLLGILRGNMEGLSGVKNPFTEWLTTLNQMVLALQAAANVAAGNQINWKPFVPDGPNGYEGFGSGTSNTGSGNYGGIAGAGQAGGGGMAVTVNVAGSVTSERDLVAAITKGLYNNQASGTPVGYSTQY